MNKKGGRTSTTWAGGWNMGETTTVRIPKALKGELMAYARARDAGECLLQGNNSDVVLSAIAAYKKIRSTSIHPNQFSKGNMNINTRAWDELRRFAKLVEEQPHLLGLNE
jgi:hypothetical protein